MPDTTISFSPVARQDDPASSHDVVKATARIAASYFSNNAVPADQIASTISAISSSLMRPGNGPAAAPEAPQPPAVSISKSITPDHLICLEDGRKLKMLKRYLRAQYDMSPEDYRQKWRLPPDYPMVAPNYAKQRSAFAKKIGLGRKTEA